jgi:hypothetical protein
VYCTDFITRETLFQFPARPAARSVILEIYAAQQPRRVPMQRRADHWIARVKLPIGWWIYRFEVDGKPQWDRAIGKMKTRDGRPCSLAMISTGLKHPREIQASNQPANHDSRRSCHSQHCNFGQDVLILLPMA